VKTKLFVRLIVVVLLLSACAPSPAAEPEKPAKEGYTIAMVVKNLGNPFFEAAEKGGKEAAAELGDEFIFQGPSTPTAEGQIEIIDALIAQKVDVTRLCPQGVATSLSTRLTWKPSAASRYRFWQR
jgi:ABC-type sugar transport system substrate-binding protein